MVRSEPAPNAPFRLQTSVALGSGFAFFAALPGVVIIIGGVIDTRNSLWASAVVSILAGVGLCVLGAAHWRRAIPDQLVEWAPGGLAVILAVQAAGHLLTTGDPETKVYLLLCMVSTGATVPRWWLIAVVDAILAAAYFLALTGLGHAVPVSLPEIAELVISVLTGAALYCYHSSGRKQLHALTEKIGELAARDALTGLLNRRGLPASVPPGGHDESITAAICVDVNGFKAINDELGHSAGDAILCTVAERLSRLVRKEDLVARTGGDEFLVVAELDDERALTNLRQRITAQLTGTAGVLELPWSVSVGTAWRSPGLEGGVTIEALMHEADVAMYDDKRRQRGERLRQARDRAIREPTAAWAPRGSNPRLTD